jgi:hypothetical protein
MYAISIIDLLIDKIYCFTDKTNQKPLYFYKEDNTFLLIKYLYFAFLNILL